MRRTHLAGLGLLLLPLAGAVILPNIRGVKPPPLRPEPLARFDREQSAALFVGVRRFTRDSTLAPVRFAVDDAVDLAYAFALDPNVALVPPHRVVLALSGQPEKAESKKRLEELKAAHATVTGADRPRS